MPTYGEVFAGIGGLSLGLERAGWTPRWFAEDDPFCRAVLAKHWPDVPCFGDVGTVTGAELERVDLMAGGFPCQPVSVAGKRRAQADARWLWPEYARLVRALRPGLVLVENVPGLYQRGLGDILADLAASGYDAEWDCVPAAAVGAPHLRERIFVVAYTNSVADAPEHGLQGQRRSNSGGAGQSEQSLPALADADGDGELQPARVFTDERGRLGDGSGWWAVEPDVGRVAHGVARRVERLRGLGNAVVPQVAEWIGQRLMALADGAGWRGVRGHGA